ncbi:penicillin-binding protein 2 [Patescibacteria group bacterium]|nr:penicillin-binding protein 2 [Patescibacteria group bacterium]
MNKRKIKNKIKKNNKTYLDYYLDKLDFGIKINRIVFLQGLFSLLFLLVILRLFSMQVIEYKVYEAQAESMQNNTEILKAERGEIYITSRDDNLNFVTKDNKINYIGLDEVAVNINKYDISISPKNIYDLTEDVEKIHYNILEDIPEKIIESVLKEEILNKEIILNKIIKIFGDKIDKEVISSRLDKKNDPYEIIYRDAKEKDADNLKKWISDKYIEALEPLANEKFSQTLLNYISYISQGLFNFEKKQSRYYPDDNLFSSITGFTRVEDEILIGQYGLEGTYNEKLKGRNGKIKGKKDIKGRMINNSDEIILEKEDGVDLILTLDKAIQYNICKILEEEAEKYKPEEASVTVMNPYTGEILGMCNYPNYNPNKYNEVENVRTYVNPVIMDQYEPGSIFKVITVASGINEGIIDAYSTYIDPGCMELDDWPYPICNSDYKTIGPRGKQTMIDILDKSLNTGSWYISDTIGKNKAEDYIKNFGFGEKTGIELGGEVSGNIDNLEIKNDIYYATASFGQGIAITQIQFLSAFSAIVSDGYLRKPYIIKATYDKNKDELILKEPEKVRKVIEESSAITVRGMLVSVVEKGHAKLAQVPGYYVGGKTGTAQIAEDGVYTADRTMQSFVGFGPIDNPNFAILITLKNPETKYSSESAAPIFSKVSSFLFDYYEVPLQKDPYSSN